ncbi:MULTISPECIES: TIGR01906 family membrane protein [unclassified Brevibacterium]|uniref:TIGR01906 family membrane protein n=1 Tax=unclassified Brevibacterium TaxID=2614124 RepID=UPI0008A1B33F|nr:MULTISPECIES: TIGR01906 family membrane protein [unclassified Brevibacterium]OFL67236.1 hypothetical protein HMPREF2757_11070 [Brevibacterium sp. HMSC063G07]
MAEKSNTPESSDDLVSKRMKTAENTQADAAERSEDSRSAKSVDRPEELGDTAQYEAYPPVRRQEPRVRRPTALSEEEWRYLGDRGAGRTAKAEQTPVELLSQTRLYRKFTFFDVVATAWVILAVPFITLAVAVRTVASGLFLKFEYFHRPGFPADEFGFSDSDRLHFGSYTVDYLYNADSKRYLADVVAGNGVPVFNEAEVAHMADVKGLVQILTLVAIIGLIGAVLAGLYLSRPHGPGLRIGVRFGAVLTLVSILVLGVLALVSWDGFFRGFHSLFFSAGTWEFYIDDSLIRLFPQTFWMDAGIASGAIILLASGLLIGLSFIGHGRRKKARAAVKSLRERQNNYNRQSEAKNKKQRKAKKKTQGKAQPAKKTETVAPAPSSAATARDDKRQSEDQPTEEYTPEDITSTGKDAHSAQKKKEKKSGLRKKDADYSLSKKPAEPSEVQQKD